MQNPLTALAKNLSIAGILLTLASCGGGGGGGFAVGTQSNTTSSGQGGTGTVGLLLTDKPADPDLFLEINVSIESVDLLGGDDNRYNLYSGPTKTVNLLDLKNESMPFAFDDKVPEGEYCKIRLTLSELELVLADNTPETAADNDREYPRLPGNKKLDLNVRGCFELEDDTMVVLQLDMDAGRSIHVVKNKKGYQFRPVVFVDVLTTEFKPKLVRLEGTMKDYDEESDTFVLCGALPSANLDGNGCAEITLDENSAFFDNIEYSGAPRALDEIFEENNLNTAFTVVGWPQYRSSSIYDIDIPDDLLPGDDECILWDTREDAEDQSAPVDCDSLPDDVNLPYVIVDEDGIEKDDYPLLVVKALAVEQGDFLQVIGDAQTDADNDGVTIDLAPGSPIVADDLAIAFQDGDTGINGTRFVSKAGVLLDYEAVVEDIEIQVDGVLEIPEASDPLLNAALVIVNLESITEDGVTGEVSSVGADSVLVTLDNEEVCGVMLSQFEIDLNDSFVLLTVNIDDNDSAVIPGGEFEVGQQVGINGNCEGTELDVDSVVIINDER